jgi:hypothetical protein
MGHLKLKNVSVDFVFVLPTAMFGIWGLVIYCWKGLENTFPMVYYTPKYSNITIANEKKPL